MQIQHDNVHKLNPERLVFYSFNLRTEFQLLIFSSWRDYVALLFEKENEQVMFLLRNRPSESP